MPPCSLGWLTIIPHFCNSTSDIRAPMTALQEILDKYRAAALTAREKGTYFENLIQAYLRNEPAWRDRLSRVWTYAEWAKRQGITAKDTGIDLVAESPLGETFAVQCKFYEPDQVISKAEIDSFFTASGKKPFTHRLLVLSVDQLTENAEEALQDQQPPVTTIRLADLEASQIDTTVDPRQLPNVTAGASPAWRRAPSGERDAVDQRRGERGGVFLRGREADHLLVWP